MAGDADNLITLSDQYAMASKTAPLENSSPGYILQEYDW